MRYAYGIACSCTGLIVTAWTTSHHHKSMRRKGAATKRRQNNARGRTVLRAAGRTTGESLPMVRPGMDGVRRRGGLAPGRCRGGGCRALPVALAGVGQDGHDGLAGVLVAGGQLKRGGEGSAARDAGVDALSRSQLARGGDGVLGRNGEHVVDGRGVIVLRDEAGDDALDAVLARRAAVQDRRLGGLDGDGGEARLARLEGAGNARDGAARAHAAHDDVDGAGGVAPDLLGGGRLVDGGVRGVLELLRDDGVGRLGVNLLGLGDGPLDAVGGGRQHELRAVLADKSAPLDRHGLGKHDDHSVAERGAEGGKRDAGVAARGLDDRATGLELAGALGGSDQRVADPVLHGARGVEVLELHEDAGLEVMRLREAAHLEQRRVADELDDALGDIFEQDLGLVGHDVLLLHRGCHSAGRGRSPEKAGLCVARPAARECPSASRAHERRQSPARGRR